MLELQFAECVMRVNHADRYIETVFRDGTIASARPNWEIMDVARAHDLGYDGDCWEMCQDHEVLHTLVGQVTGNGRSVVLWNVAHGGGNRWPLLGREEEGYVMSLQRWLRRGFGVAPLSATAPSSYCGWPEELRRQYATVVKLPWRAGQSRQPDADTRNAAQDASRTPL